MKLLCLILFSLAATMITLNAQSLIFEYDESGNQILREIEKVKIIDPEAPDNNSFTNNEVRVYPNPVESELTVSWNPDIADLVIKIEVLPYNTFSSENVEFKSYAGKAIMDMRHKPPGIYYLKIYCSDGRIINRTIIKT